MIKKDKEKEREYQKKYREDNKEKAKEYIKNWKIKNSDYIKEYGKDYRNKNKDYFKEYSKKYKENNKERKKTLDKEYREKHKNTLEYKKMKNDNHKKYAQRHPEIIKAHNKTHRFILLKPACEICGDMLNLEGHHWNYNKPLLVNTLCKPCHQIQHTKNFYTSVFGR